MAKLPHTIGPGETSRAYKSETRKASLVANRAYTWQVDNFLMDQTMATIRRILTDSLLSGDTSWQQRLVDEWLS